MKEKEKENEKTGKKSLYQKLLTTLLGSAFQFEWKKKKEQLIIPLQLSVHLIYIEDFQNFFQDQPQMINEHKWLPNTLI